MKTPALLRHFLLAINLAAALALLPPEARAEDKPPARQKTPPASAGSSSWQEREALEALNLGYDLAIVDDWLVLKGQTVTKQEATLANIVDALRIKFSVNITMSPGLANVKITNLKLRGNGAEETQLRDTLEALRVASGDKFIWSKGGGGVSAPGLIDPSTGLPVAQVVSESNLYILREPMPTPENERVVEAFNLSSYIEWLASKQDPNEERGAREQFLADNLAEVQKIIGDMIARLKEGTGAEMDRPSFQFHRGANLLVVIGTAPAVDVARKVVNALPGRERFPGPTVGGGAAPGGGLSSPDAVAELLKRYGAALAQPPQNVVPGAPESRKKPPR